MAYVSMKQMLETGVHFGHQTRRWNPKMRPYIFGARNGIHIIDLQQTVKLFRVAYDKVVDTVAKGGKVSMPSVWAKKCRGAMTAWILRNRLAKAEDIIGFSSDGFIYKGDDGGENCPVFVAEK